MAAENAAKISSLANPVVKHLAKITETDDNHATHRGIAAKCMFFMVMIIVGGGIDFLLHNVFPFVPDLSDQNFYATIPECIGLVAALIMSIGCSIAAALVVSATPFFGALSCMSYGYIIGLVANITEEFKGAVLMAGVFTFAIVFAMQVIFSTGKISVSNKFRSIVYSILFAWVIGGGLFALMCYIVPDFAFARAYVEENSILSIGISMAGVVLAVLFLFIDFDNINKTVEQRLPKKYEWCAAFGLTMSIIWLYFEILNLILKLKDNN